MLNLTRRKLFISASGVITGLALLAGIRLPDYWAERQFRSAVDKKFIEIFGADIHGAPASQSFLTDYLTLLAESTEQRSVNDMTLSYLQSSNVVEHRETGAELEYSGLFDAYETPCANRLGASFAPERG